MNRLSARENAVLATIATFQEVEGRTPSLREIATAIGVTDITGAARVVDRLRQRNLLTRSRSVRGAKRSSSGGLKILHSNSPEPLA